MLTRQAVIDAFLGRMCPSVAALMVDASDDSGEAFNLVCRLRSDRAFVAICTAAFVPLPTVEASNGRKYVDSSAKWAHLLNRIARLPPAVTSRAPTARPSARAAPGTSRCSRSSDTAASAPAGTADMDSSAPP